jgi:hypothetical protein
VAEAARTRNPLTDPKQHDREVSLARERQAAFVACALMGAQEAAAWCRDRELSRRVGAALGRSLELVRELARVNEADE